jgi:Uma2 family endonuclease
MLGLKKIDKISMGTSALQWFITNMINRHLNRVLPPTYLCGPGELGAHNSNFSANIAIFRPGQLKVGFQSINYSTVPPSVVIEVDIKIDESEYFQNEEEYFHKKTEQLLQWGVERVIWVFSASRRVLVADNLKTWSFISWNLPFVIIDNHQVNVWELMLANGFEA